MTKPSGACVHDCIGVRHGAARARPGVGQRSRWREVRVQRKHGQAWGPRAQVFAAAVLGAAVLLGDPTARASDSSTGASPVDAGPPGMGPIGNGTVHPARVRGHLLDATAELKSGDLDPAEVTRFIKLRHLAAEGCYERELQKIAELHGKIVVTFTIATNGRVSTVKIDQNEMGNDAVGACLKSVVSAWYSSFRPSVDATVVYPFVFQPAS
jgi:TonB family protein